ncbi:hypothetical protein [Streptomyces sp. NPDC005423]
MPTELRSGPSLPGATAADPDRRLTLRRHVDLGRCSSARCTAG